MLESAVIALTVARTREQRYWEDYVFLGYDARRGVRLALENRRLGRELGGPG